MLVSIFQDLRTPVVTEQWVIWFIRQYVDVCEEHPLGHVIHPQLVLLLIAVMDGRQGHWQTALFRCLHDFHCGSLEQYWNCQKLNSLIIKSYIVHWDHIGVKVIEISFDKHFLIMWNKLMTFRYQYERHEKTDCERRHKKKLPKQSNSGWCSCLVSVSKVHW